SRIERIIEHSAARTHERICRHIRARVLVADLHDVGDAALAVLRCLCGVSILPLRIQRLKLLAIEARVLFLGVKSSAPGSAGPMALGLVSTALGHCVLCLEPKDRHVADVVGSPDLDQRLPTLEAGGSNLGRENFANGPGGLPTKATLFL